MVSFLIFAGFVILVAIVVGIACDLAMRLIPGLPAEVGMIVRLLIALVALLAILQRGLPLIGEGRLL